MPRPSTDTRERLLAAAVEYAAHHGLADLSLRTLAAALGTSHRMLIFHFGSKEGLLVEVVRAVEAQQRALLDRLRADPELSPLDRTRAFWQHLASPELWPYERLFFEVYAQGLHGKEPATRLLEDAVQAWLAPTTDLLVSQGVPPDQARAEARLGIAVTRGLLLDLLATGDRDAVDAAMDRFTALYLHARPELADPEPAGKPRRKAVLTEDMRRVVREQRLAFVATVCPDGTPNLSPKGTIAVWDDRHLVFADLRSPRTVANLRSNPAVEVNVVDPIARKGYRFKGEAQVLTDGALYEEIMASFEHGETPVSDARSRIRHVVLVRVERALPLLSPAYDLGLAEDEIRATWWDHFQALNPRPVPGRN